MTSKEAIKLLKKGWEIIEYKNSALGYKIFNGIHDFQQIGTRTVKALTKRKIIVKILEKKKSYNRMVLNEEKSNSSS